MALVFLIYAIYIVFGTVIGEGMNKMYGLASILFGGDGGFIMCSAFPFTRTVGNTMPPGDSVCMYAF